LYSFSQSVVGWTEDNYKTFIGSLKQETMSFYTTKTQNNKGSSLTITRENIQFIKNDLEYLLKLFSTIIPLMILDKKFKLFVE
jgi:flagellar basal body rod protein FlgB